MDVELEKYKKDLECKSINDLFDIYHHIDRDVYPERYEFVKQRIQELNRAPIISTTLPGLPKYATRMTRIEARLIDGLIFIPFAVVNFFFYSKVPLLSLVLVHMILIASSAYFVLLHVRKGATIGKRSLRIRVVDANGNRISWKSSLIREAPNYVYVILSLLGVLFLLGRINMDKLPELNLLTAFASIQASYSPLIKSLSSLISLWGFADILSIFFSSKNRTLHDIMAGTYVINYNSVD